jgi:threonine dehydrogenase-like Zn-dependent dehydrogenase
MFFSPLKIQQRRIFWLRRLGCSKIVVAARTDKHASLAGSMGADAFIGTLREDFERELLLSLGSAPDIVFDCAGAPGVLELAVRCVRRRGVVVGMGLCMQKDLWTPAEAMGKQIRMQFCAAYSMAEFHRSIDVLATGTPEPHSLVSATISLQELPRTFEQLRVSSPLCKVMVDPLLAHRSA